MSHAFEHACRRCARSFSPNVDLEVFAVLTAVCPYCGFNHGYDNREGQILRLVSEKYGALRAEKREEVAAPAAPVETHYEAPARSFFAPPAAEEKPIVAETVAAEITPPPEAEPAYEEHPYQKYEAPEFVEATAVVKETAPRWHQRAREKIAIGKDFLSHLSPRRYLVAAAIATIAFVGTILVMQAIPVSSEEARQAVASLKARQADVVLDRNGHELNKLGVSQSDKAELSEFHKWQLDALLFAEDRKFYEHHGVQYSSILRAILNNALRLRYAQGASTITQQLARIILQNRKKSIFRKLTEVRLARALEVILSKQKILDLYVNNVYLGHGNYSFASAAKFYYNRSIRDLTANEFLSIVALIPSPEKFSPLKNNRRLLVRMQNLYDGMTAAGILQVSPAAWQKGMDSVTEQSGRFASETAFGEKSRSGLWPAQFARDFLMQRKILFAENQNSARVYTTIDGELQERAEALVQKHLERGRKNFRGVLKSEDSDEIRLKTRLRRAAYDSGLMLELAGLGVAREAEPQLQAALIAMSPRTGEILAMVGGDSFESKNQLNRTVQMRRQTGSAIKPFIYAKATSLHLIHAASLIDDTPYVVGSGSKVWAPENINGGFEGPMPARDALAKSRNIPAIRVGRLIGRDGVTELFSEFFFQSENALNERFRYDETVAIGTISLSPLEMARAFSVFANNGFLNDPILITRVEGHEKVMDLRKTHADQLGLTAAAKERLLSAAETALMVSLLKSSGKNSGSGLPGVIGKTGTSSESRDLWFVGGGKEIVVAVWFGFDDMRYSIPGATGSALASKLAGEFLGQDFTPVDFKMQPGMVRMRVCPLSGKIASEGCSHARSEIFLSGVLPEGECLHGSGGGAAGEADFMAVMGDSQFR
ncbi:MAG: transglycosylase domain-containing protein [Spirochaetes bacterium]|nr:transglycosylase domain-containing protein [Spirochaetota bacterium]